ncbi:MAG: metallophosphoesterase family protein, partial [Planctomycetota bacterium]
MSRFAVISDVHANLQALEAVLQRIDELGLEEVLCLGDVVGYGPHPDRCLDLVIRCCATIVRGNHDDAVINAQREAEFNGPAREAIAWTRGMLGPLHLGQIVRLKTIERPHASIMCVHDCPVPGPTDYVHDPHIASLAFAGIESPICLLGHTHVPTVFEAPTASGAVDPEQVVVHDTDDGVAVPLNLERRYICNPGSVGQPRDADPRASFAVLDLDTPSFTVHRVEYDIDATQLATQQAGLPLVLAERLSIGA